MLNAFEEIPWQFFQNLPDIKHLPLHEQVYHYDQYISNLSLQRMHYSNWLQGQASGRAAGAGTAGGNTGDLAFDEATTLWEDSVGNWDA